MSPTESLRSVMASNNLDELGLLLDYLRFRKGMNYQSIFDHAQKATGISLAEWEDLMGELEEHENES